MLATSQAPLNLREERVTVRRCRPLEPASRRSSSSSSAAQGVKPSFELTDDNRDAVEAICARLDGLPLALELAAARVKLLTPAGDPRAARREPRLAHRRRRRLPERHRTLRDAIEWSYNLLERARAEPACAARRLRRRLLARDRRGGVRRRREPIGAVLDTIASLVDKSLVRQWDGGDGEPRFGMLETIREFAIERLTKPASSSGCARRHAERYLALVEAAEPELTRANQAIWLERLDEEADNIRAALAWAIERRRGRARRRGSRARSSASGARAGS